MKKIVYDQIVFGGGIVGASIFNKLTRQGQKVLLIEKENDVATGASKANSGIIHAGFDAMSGTLKAKLNVRGNVLVKKLAKELSVPFKNVETMVVSEDKDKLEDLMTRGKINGVPNLKIITNPSSLEKNLNKKYKYALIAETGGIVNPYLLTIALCEEAVLNGGKFRLSFNTEKIEKTKEGFAVSNGKETLYAKKLINAAGSGYNDISKLIGAEKHKITFRRGEYIILKKMDYVSRTIFPLPTPTSKGVMISPTVDGNILIGPTSIDGNYEKITTSLGIKEIKEHISEMMTNTPFKASIREFSGIRAAAGDDFVVEKSKLINGLINVAGINSPGLTAAPAIAERISELLEINSKETIKIKRQPYQTGGRIICKCESVTESEVINAIHSPIPATTIDGIKRRVRAGMGPCQGGYCGLKVASILARELKIPLEKVLKGSEGSSLMPGDFNEVGV